MEESKDPKARVNPAARHDAPETADAAAQRPRTPDRQVKPEQSAELNPLDPGGIGE
jgi:hypothetical protein